MAQRDTSKMGAPLEINGNYYNTLDIEAFSQMMKDPSYCYKFYWLEAIVHLISHVQEFHIHLSGYAVFLACRIKQQFFRK